MLFSIITSHKGDTSMNQKNANQKATCKDVEIACYKTELSDKNAETANKDAEIQRLRAELEKYPNS